MGLFRYTSIFIAASILSACADNAESAVQTEENGVSEESGETIKVRESSQVGIDTEIGKSSAEGLGEIERCASSYRGALIREYDGSGMSEEHLMALARSDCSKMSPQERASFVIGADDGVTLKSSPGIVASKSIEKKSAEKRALNPDEPVCQIGKIDESGSNGVGAPVPVSDRRVLESQIPALKIKNPDADFVVMCEGGE